MNAKSILTLLIVVILICFVAAAIGLSIRNNVEPNQYYAFNIVVMFLATMICGAVIKPPSTASLQGNWHGIQFRAGGSLAGFLIVGIVLYLLTPAPKPPKSIQVILKQGGGLFAGTCDVTWQLPSGDNQTHEITGSRVFGGVPANVTSIQLWEVKSFGKVVVPKNMKGNAPWTIPLTDGKDAEIDLPDPPVKTTCKAPSREDVANWIKGKGTWDYVTKGVEIAKANPTPKEIRTKKILWIANTTKWPVNIVGMDCRRLFEKPDEFDLEASDWLDFTKFLGLDEREEIPFQRFDDMKDTTGWFCLFACVVTPEGERAVYLGVHNFFEHDETHMKLIKGDPTQNKIVLVPDTSPE